MGEAPYDDAEVDQFGGGAWHGYGVGADGTGRNSCRAGTRWWFAHGSGAGRSSAAPQQNADGSYTIRTNARLVVLDVVVLDKKGNVVTDLKKDDFHVTEAGEPQTIQNFVEAGVNRVGPEATINSTAELDRLAPRPPVTVKAATDKPGGYIVHIDAKGVAWTYATETTPRFSEVIVRVTTFDKKGKQLKE